MGSFRRLFDPAGGNVNVAGGCNRITRHLVFVSPGALVSLSNWVRLNAVNIFCMHVVDVDEKENLVKAIGVTVEL